MPDTVALLLPGMTLNATIFPDLGIPTLAVDFTRLIVGADGWSPELERRRMGFFVDRLVTRLADEPTWNEANRRIVVAHSFGGFLALAWQLERAGDAAARIDGLVLIATSAGPLYDAVRLRLLGSETWAVRVPVRATMRVWNNRTVTRALAWLAAPTGQLQDVDFGALRVRSDLAVGLAGWRNTDWRSRRSYRLAMQGFDVRHRLSFITAPSIVLHGPRDAFFPISVARGLARGLPRGELRLVPRAAHMLPLTHGDTVVDAVWALKSGRSCP
jgi:pimeloyl-ACP methyl ester carboxylesterase